MINGFYTELVGAVFDVNAGPNFWDDDVLVVADAAAPLRAVTAKEVVGIVREFFVTA